MYEVRGSHLYVVFPRAADLLNGYLQLFNVNEPLACDSFASYFLVEADSIEQPRPVNSSPYRLRLPP